MNEVILADTDVLVDYLRGHPMALSLVKEHKKRIIVSAITVAELYAGVRGPTEMEALEDALSFHRVVPVTTGTAESAGLLKREYGKSHGLGLPDAIVAATAQSENAELWTLNVKHFPMFPGLKPAYTK